MKIAPPDLVALVEAFTQRERLVMEDMRQQITRLAKARAIDGEEIERLQSQLAASVFQPVYDGTAHDREQLEQDAALGRLVRAMPACSRLHRWGTSPGGGFQCYVREKGFLGSDAPEEALRAAGIGTEAKEA